MEYEVVKKENGVRMIHLSENGKNIWIDVNDKFEVVFFSANQGWGAAPKCKPED